MESKPVYSMFLYVYRGDPSDQNRCFGFRDDWVTAADDEAAIKEMKEFIASMNGKVRQLWLTPKGKRKNILMYHFGEYVTDAPRPKEGV